MAKNQATLKGVPTYIGPESSREADITPEQKALTPSDAAKAIIARSPQVAKRTADAAEFQPSRSHDASGPVPGTNTENYFQESLGQREGHMAGACGDERPSRIVGDLVTGGPRDGYATQGVEVNLGGDMASGQPDADPFTPGAQDAGTFHKGVTDWPEEKGSGTTPMQKGAQLGK